MNKVMSQYKTQRPCPYFECSGIPGNQRGNCGASEALFGSPCSIDRSVCDIESCPTKKTYERLSGGSQNGKK